MLICQWIVTCRFTVPIVLFKLSFVSSSGNIDLSPIFHLSAPGYLSCNAIGVKLCSSNDMLAGRWTLGWMLITPSVSSPWRTLQDADCTASRTVFTAASHPSTIKASYSLAHFNNFLGRFELHMHNTNWCIILLLKISVLIPASSSWDFNFFICH